jgi:hypothetical protein
MRRYYLPCIRVPVVTLVLLHPNAKVPIADVTSRTNPYQTPRRRRITPPMCSQGSAISTPHGDDIVYDHLHLIDTTCREFNAKDPVNNRVVFVGATAPDQLCTTIRTSVSHTGRDIGGRMNLSVTPATQLRLLYAFLSVDTPFTPGTDVHHGGRVPAYSTILATYSCVFSYECHGPVDAIDSSVDQFERLECRELVSLLVEFVQVLV